MINLTGILFEKGQSFEDVQAQGAGNIASAAAAAGVTKLVHVSAIGADAESDFRLCRRPRRKANSLCARRSPTP